MIRAPVTVVVPPLVVAVSCSPSRYRVVLPGLTCSSRLPSGAYR